jgi:glycosyltransferase involved in cell wall biosynthesis
VIIPCRNQGRLLQAALASVTTQTLQPSQVIVVDDGSTDETVEVARAHPGVTLIRQQHSGAAAARNAGLARVEADLITFLDADDLWPATSLRARVTALVDTGADGCFGVVEEFLDQSARTQTLRPITSARLAGSVLVTRDSLERVGAFDTSLLGGEVVDWIARFDTAGLRWTQVNEVVLQRRIHDANTSRDPKYSRRTGLLEVARRSVKTKRSRS